MKIAMLLDNPLCPDNRVEKEATTLVKAGHKVTIYCKMQEGLNNEEWRNGYRIKRVFKYNLGTSTLVDKYLISHIDLINSISEKYHIYHCHDCETWPIGYILSQRDKAKLICDSHEYFPDYIIKENYAENMKYKTAKLLGAVRGNYIKHADAVITVSEGFSDSLYKEYNLRQKPIVLYNTRPYSQRAKNKSNLLREEFDISSNKNIVFFQGNIESSRGVDSILKSLNKVESDIIFIIAGNCSTNYLDYLKSIAKNNKILDKFRYVGFLDNTKLTQYTASADILVYYPKGEVKNITHGLPNKFFDYVFATKPIILKDLPCFREFMSKYEVGFMCNSEEEIAEHIDKLIKDKNINNQKLLNCKIAQQEVCWERQEEKLLKLYNKLFE